MGVLLEPLDPISFEKYVDLFVEYMREFGYETKRHELKQLLDGITQEGWYLPWLVRVEGEYVGFCATTRGYSPIDLCRSLELTDLYIVPQSRAKGIGRETLLALEARARSLNIRKLFVNADANTIGFYAKLEWSLFEYRYMYKRLD